ncbi:MAG: hypothetical protein JW784_06575 [Candidatus Cloacimonetes bacterium]|nr:hypothetical protein [Candidatus Cloacimonadota bacterium]
MYFRIIKSEQGFGLLHVLAALFMVTIAITGLFLANVYARSRAIENYHYRAALLATMENMERIRYNYYQRQNSGPVHINDINNNINRTVTLDMIDNYRIECTIAPSYPRVERKTDLSVATYVYYDEVVLRMNWQEPTLMFKPKEGRSITLREDYYYRMDLGNE